jgi:hypothetical protein
MVGNFIFGVVIGILFREQIITSAQEFVKLLQ